MCVVCQFIKWNINRHTVYLAISILYRGFWLFFFSILGNRDIKEASFIATQNLKSLIRKKKKLKSYPEILFSFH